MFDGDELIRAVTPWRRRWRRARGTSLRSGRQALPLAGRGPGVGSSHRSSVWWRETHADRGIRSATFPLVGVATTFVMAASRGDPIMMLFMAGLGGSLRGFVVYNFSPA